MEDYALTMDGCLRLNEILQKKIANDMPGELADVLSTLMASDIKGKLKVRPARGACPGQPAKLRRRSSDACLHANPQNIAESKLGATVQKLTKHDDGKVNSLATKLKNSWAAAAAQAKAAKVEPAPAAAAAAAAAAASAAAAAAAASAAAAAASSAAETKLTVAGPSSSGLVAAVKPEPVPLTASSSISVSAPSRSTSKTGDRERDMVREKLQDAFEVGKEANARYLREQYVDTAAMAEEAENNMNAKLGRKEYKARYRSLIFNLKDEKNPEFIRMVMTGQLHVNDLATMEVREMASDEMKKQRAAHTEYAKMALMDSKTYKQYAGKETQDGILKCPRCKSMKTEYVEVQTRSADEPTTKKCTCNSCEYRWKFC